MTRKDYNAIAATLSARRSMSPKTVDRIAHDFANLCERDNPRFDRNRFLLAVGVKDRRYS